MAGWHHWLDGHESEWTLGVGDRQGGLVCCDSWGCKELDTIERLNWIDGNSVCTFFVEPTVFFHRGFTNFHSHQQCRRVSFVSRLPMSFLFHAFLMMADLACVNVIFLWIFDLHFCNHQQCLEPFYMWNRHLDVYFAELSILLPAYFFIPFIFFYYWVVWAVYVYIWEIKPSSFTMFSCIYCFHKVIF